MDIKGYNVNEKIAMDIRQSLLSREQSTFLKGILILLIVLGHNGILMGKYPGMQKIVLNDFLYCFHVYSFFFITSLYNWKPIAWESVKKNFLKLYKPFTVMFILLAFMNYYMMHQSVGLLQYLNGFINGSDPVLKETIGMSFPWFLASMFSFLIIRDIWAVGNKSINYCIAILSLSLVLLYSLRVLKHSHEGLVPFGLIAALRVFGLCVICRYLFERFNKRKAYKIFIVIGAVVISIIYLNINNLQHDGGGKSLLTYTIIPFFMFQFLGIVSYSIKNYNRYLLYLGHHSFDIYLIHLLVYNMICMALQKIQIETGIVIGCIVYVLTLCFTLLLNSSFGRLCPWGYKFLYSRIYKYTE